MNCFESRGSKGQNTNDKMAKCQNTNDKMAKCQMKMIEWQSVEYIKLQIKLRKKVAVQPVEWHYWSFDDSIFEMQTVK